MRGIGSLRVPGLPPFLPLQSRSLRSTSTSSAYPMGLPSCCCLLVLYTLCIVRLVRIVGLVLAHSKQCRGPCPRDLFPWHIGTRTLCPLPMWSASLWAKWPKILGEWPGACLCTDRTAHDCCSCFERLGTSPATWRESKWSRDIVAVHAMAALHAHLMQHNALIAITRVRRDTVQCGRYK
jgi:hypothetical protein